MPSPALPSILAGLATPYRLLAVQHQECQDCQRKCWRCWQCLIEVSMNTDRKSYPLISLDSLTAKPIAWLWRGYIPVGAVTILEGDPATGKSSLARDLIARVTSGLPMPGETEGQPASRAILLQAEDSLATVKAGLNAMGANLSNVIVVNSDNSRGRFRLPDDLSFIEAEVIESKSRILVIDPISSFTDALSSSEGRARECFDKLAGFAERTGIGVVIVRHFRKSSVGREIHRGIGSIGAIAVARSVLAIADSTEKHRHTLVQAKTNLVSAAKPLEYRTIQRGDAIAIEWLGPSDKPPEELFGPTIADPTAREEAAKVLFAVLENGPVPARDVYKTARAAGISKRTLDRVKRDIHVKSRKSGSGRDSKWFWQLPEKSEAVKTLQEKAHDELCNDLFHGEVVLDDPSQIESGSPPKDGDDDNFADVMDE